VNALRLAVLRLQLWWIEWDIQTLRHQQEGIEYDLRDWQSRRHELEMELLHARAELSNARRA
jgi:hypothetical protein